MSSITASALWGLSPAAMMLHSENMFPLLEPGGFDLVAEMMTAAHSLSLSLCRNNAIRAAARG